MQRPKLDRRYTFVLLEKGAIKDWVYFTAESSGYGGIDLMSTKEYRDLPGNAFGGMDFMILN
ncbi:hypothetical protein [Acanthopleuribacter pedis]|uniref:Uncharacterized protein n=1 Tax=Acanthopleuribacter pedis TaxID=442870 RepID=A0A8J7Q8E3_9BACT|nr:hypothetical protein [Acanthopleuribacter pedis]MBO1319920.1 hypothetical protein [Acanthopleuribacter pedis]